MPVNMPSLLDFTDPNTTSMLGMIAGLGEASAPSRLPVTNGMMFGDMAKGLLSGAQQGYVNKQLGTDTLLKQYEIPLKQMMGPTAYLQLLTSIQGYNAMAPKGSQIAPADIMKGLPGFGGMVASNPQPAQSVGLLDRLFGKDSDKSGSQARTSEPSDNDNGLLGKLMSGDAATGGSGASITGNGQGGVQIGLPGRINVGAGGAPVPQPIAASTSAAPGAGAPMAAPASAGDPTYGELPNKISQITRGQLSPADVSRMYFNPALSKALPDIIKQNMPGPTDFMRAYQDYTAARGSPAEGLALQRLQNAAGDRYQLMRNGWAYDRVTKQWMHMPEFGVGVTGSFDPDTGRMSATTVPGAPEAAATMSRAEASGPAHFRFSQAFGPFGQAFQGSDEQLARYYGGSGGPGGNAQSGSPQGGASGGLSFGGGMTYAPTPNGNVPSAQPASASSATAAPQPGVKESAAPNTKATQYISPMKLPVPVTVNGARKDITQVTLDDLFPGGQGIPLPPTPPKGLGYGPPSEGQKKIAADDAEQLQKWQQASSMTPEVMQNVSHLRDILQRGLNTGLTADLIGDFNNLLHQSGHDELINKNLSPNDVDAFNKAATRLVFAFVQKIGGRILQSEIEGAKQGGVDSAKTPEANMSVLTDVMALSRMEDVRTNLASQYVTRTGGAPLAPFTARFNQMVPLDEATNNLKQVMRDEYGFKFPGDQGTPENPKMTPEKWLGSLTPDQRAKVVDLQKQYGMLSATDKKGAPGDKLRAALKQMGAPE